MSEQTLLSDRDWFERHPHAVVRFRRQHRHEFSALSRQGHSPPVFKPSFSTKPDEAATWVAVVDLLQLLQTPGSCGNPSRLRLRMRTIPLRSAQQRQQARRELIQAVASELLNQELTHEARPAMQDAA